MTIRIGKIGNSINDVLTIINIYLFGILTFMPVDFKKIKEKRIPLVVNVGLLLLLSLTIIYVLNKLLTPSAVPIMSGDFQLT
jgi:hypothetical protein